MAMREDDPRLERLRRRLEQEGRDRDTGPDTPDDTDPIESALSQDEGPDTDPGDPDERIERLRTELERASQPPAAGELPGIRARPPSARRTAVEPPETEDVDAGELPGIAAAPPPGRRRATQTYDPAAGHPPRLPPSPPLPDDLRERLDTVPEEDRVEPSPLRFEQAGPGRAKEHQGRIEELRDRYVETLRNTPGLAAFTDFLTSEEEDLPFYQEWIRGMARTPSMFVEGIGGTVETIAQKLREAGSDPRHQEHARRIGLIPPEGEDDTTALERAGETLGDIGEATRAAYPESEAAAEGGLTNPSFIAARLPEALTQVGMQVLLTRFGLPAGASTATRFGAFAAPTLALEGGLSARETEQRLLERGASPEEARSRAAKVGAATGLGSALLETIPFMGLIARRIPGAPRVFRGVLSDRLADQAQRALQTRAGAAVQGFTTEGLEEAMQEAWAATMDYSLGEDPDAFMDILRRMIESFAIGGAAGSIVGTIQGPDRAAASDEQGLRRLRAEQLTQLQRRLEEEAGGQTELQPQLQVLGPVTPGAAISRQLAQPRPESFPSVADILAAEEEARAPEEVIRASRGEPPPPEAPEAPGPDSPLSRWSRLEHTPRPDAIQRLGEENVPRFEHAAEFIYNLAGIADTLQEAMETGAVPDEQLEQANRSLGRWWQRLEGALNDYSSIYGREARAELEAAMAEELAGPIEEPGAQPEGETTGVVEGEGVAPEEPIPSPPEGEGGDIAAPTVRPPEELTQGNVVQAYTDRAFQGFEDRGIRPGNTDARSIHATARRASQVFGALFDGWKTDREAGRRVYAGMLDSELQQGITQLLNEDLQELGFVQVAWDRTGEPHYARADADLPAWLADVSGMEPDEVATTLEALPSREEADAEAPTTTRRPPAEEEPPPEDEGADVVPIDDIPAEGTDQVFTPEEPPAELPAEEGIPEDYVPLPAGSDPPEGTPVGFRQFFSAEAPTEMQGTVVSTEPAPEGRPEGTVTIRTEGGREWTVRRSAVRMAPGAVEAPTEEAAPTVATQMQEYADQGGELAALARDERYQTEAERILPPLVSGWRTVDELAGDNRQITHGTLRVLRDMGRVQFDAESGAWTVTSGGAALAARGPGEPGGPPVAPATPEVPPERQPPAPGEAPEGARRQAEADPERAELLRQLFEDEQTGLRNRRAWGQARENVEDDEGTSVVVLDARNLKGVNDIQGHEAGDRFIQRIADGLQDAAEAVGVDPRDLFRVGGDEFVAVVPTELTPEFTAELERRIPEKEIPGTEMTAGFRVGVGDTFADADAALLRARDAETGPRHRGEPDELPEAPLEGAERHKKIWLAPPDRIQVDAERFQFKLDAIGPGGVSNKLAGVRVWNEDLAGIIDVWQDPETGETYVVNGHHRLQLAVDLGVGRIAMRYLDVPTAAAARVRGALTNIGEGNGTPIDAAKLMRDSGITEADFEKHGISLTGAVARDGAAISKLHDGLFQKTVTGDLPMQRAAIIGSSGLDVEGQWALYQVLQNRERSGARLTNKEVVELIRFTASAPTQVETDVSLFGEEEITRSLAIEKARVSARIRRRFVADRRLFGYLTRGGRAERLEELEAGQVDVDRAGAIAGEAANLEEFYERLATRAGPVADALNEGAQALADGEPIGEIEERIYERIKTAIEETLGGGEAGNVRELPRWPYGGSDTDHAVRYVVFESGPEYGPLEVQDDLFGEPTLSGPQQRDLFGISDLSGASSLSDAEARARATVERLRPLIEQDVASEEEQDAFREALALLRRAEAMDDEEVRIRRQRAGQEDDPDTDTMDLFGEVREDRPIYQLDQVRPHLRQLAQDLLDQKQGARERIDALSEDERYQVLDAWRELLLQEDEEARQALELVIPVGITEPRTPPVAIRDGEFVRVVSREPTDFGVLRVSTFDARGPVGHSVFQDRESVIHHLRYAARDGVERGEELLESWAQTSEFQEGLRQVREVLTRKPARHVRERGGQYGLFGPQARDRGPSTQDILQQWKAEQRRRDAATDFHEPDFLDLVMGHGRPWYYSRLRRVIEGAPMEKAKLSQWKGWLRKQPVKESEIAWVGLNEVLAGRKNSVLNRLAREAAERRAQAEALEEFGDEFDPLAFLQLQAGDVDVIPTGEKDPVVAREALLGWLAENETTIETSILTADHDLVYSPGMRRVKLLQRLLEEHGSPKPIDWSKAFDHVFLSAQVSRFVEEAMSDQGFQSYTGIANRIVHRAARMLFTDEQWTGLPVPSRIQAEREMTHYAFEETGLGRMSEIQKAVDRAAGQVVDALEAEDPSVVGEFMEDYRRWADSYLADEVQYDAYRRIDVLQGALARFQEGAGTTTHKNAAQYTSWSVPNPYHHIRNQREFGVRLGGRVVWGAPHWSDVRGNKMATNLIAHARTSDRIAFEPVAESLTAAFDEKDVLLAEELQSDWSTARRRYLEGMDHDEITEEIVRVEAELEALLEEALEDRPAEDMEGDLSILVEEPGDPRGDIVGVAIRTFADGEARTFRGDTREDVVRQIEDAGLDQIGADLFYVTDADHFIRQTEATQMYRAWTTAEIDETLAEGGSIPLRRPAPSLRALWTMVSSGRELNRDGQPAGADLSQLKPWNIEAAGNRHEELLIYLRRALRLLDEHHELDRREFAGRTHRETPDTPWTAAEDWLGLLVRRLLTAGVREGYDAVAFSTAEMVNELFNLESQVRVVWAYRHFPGTGGSEISDASGVHFVAYKHDGSVALARTYPSEEAAAQDFGSPIAERVFEQVDQERGRSFRLMKVDEALEFLTDDGLSAPVLRELRKEFAERGSLSGWWRVEQEKGTIYVGVVGDHSLESDPEAFIMKNGHTQPSGPALLYADTNIMFFQADAEARQRLEEQHNSPGWRARWGSIVVVPGSELSVGGRWQRQLYDEILPRVLRNELKWLTGKTQAPRVERRYLSDVERIKVSNLPHTDRYEVHLTGMPSPGIDEPLEDGRITVAVVDTEEQAQKIRNSLRKQYPHHTAEYTLLPAGGQVGRRAGARYRPAAWYVELTPEVRRAVLEEGFRVMERPRQLFGPEAWAAWAERRNPPERAPTNPTEEERAEMVREQLSLAFGGPEPAKRISERLAAALGSKAHMVTDGVYKAEARREIIETAREARAWVDMRGQQLDYKDPRSVIELLEWTRSPEAESLSFFGLDDDGRIVRQETLSTGAIDYAWVDEPTTNRILREMKEAGATRLIMSHNHPSGDPTMSKEDTYHAAVVAGMASRAGLELQASIVVNHEAAQVWLPFTEQFPEEGVQDDEATVERLDFKDLGMVFEYTIPRRRRFDWTQAARFQIRGPESIVELAASIGGDQDGFSVVWVDTQLRVATVTQHAAEAAASLHEWAPDMQRDFAAYGYMIYVGDNASPSTYQDIIQAANARGLHRNGPDMPVPQGLIDVVLGSTRLGTARSALEEEELVGVPERLRASGTTFVREDLPDYGGDPTSPRADDPEVTKQDLKVWEWLQETFETIGLPMALDDYNVLSRRVLGAYWAWPTYVLLRNPTDIATASHEIGHHIHKLFFGLHRRGLSGTVLAPWSAELIGVAREQGFRKSRQTRKEGLAEFFSLYVTDPARARSLAPTFYRYADTRLRNEFSVLHDALQELSERYRLWQDAPMEARADARIADKRNPLHTLRDARRNAWRRLRYEVLDDLVYIEQFDEEFDATGMTNVLARTARGAAGAGETFLSLGALDFETVDVVGPGLDEILAPVTGDRKEYKQFRRWATAIRAVELAELGIETGFDIAEQRAIIEKYESDEYREVFDQIQEWNGHLLQYLVDSGVISQELMDKLRDKHPNYLPFFRSGFDENDAMRIGGKQFAHIFSPIKKIKGSERQLLDPLVSLARLAYSYTSVAHRQELNTRLIQVAGQEGTGGWIRKIPPPTRVTRVGKQEVTDFIMGSIMSQPDPEAEGLEIGEDVFDALEEVMMVFRPGHYFGQDNIISRLDPETGKRTWYWVNDDLYGSISALKGKELDTWVRIAANPSRWLRAGATGTPDFAVRNLFRDQPWSTVMSENIHVPFEHATRGFIHRFRNYRTGAKVDPTVAKMKATGGEFAALVDMDREWIKTTTKALLRDGVPNVVTHPIQLFALISRGTENLSRTGEFAAAVKRLRAQGYEGRELYQRASLHAREVGTDYMRRGSSETIQAIRMIATFWNATTQSWDRLGRAFSNRKVEGTTGLRRWQLTTMKALGLITLPTMLLWLVNHDDEEWQEFPQWQRDLFWLVKIPRSWGGLVPDLLSADVQDTGLGRSLADRALLRRIQPFVEGSEGHVWLRVPKPFQLGIMFASIPERILDYLATGDERGVRDAVQTFIGVDPTLQAKGLGRRLQDFWSSDVGQVVIPDIQVIMPFAENFANYSRFLERPIVSRGDEGLQPWLQHGPYASEVAKELGFYLNYSPAKIDNVIQAWTGGMGQYALDAAELAGDAVGMWDRQDRPSGGITTMPFTRSFFAGPPGFGSESIERFFDEWDLASRAYRTQRALLREEDPRADEHFDANEELIMRYRMLEQVRQRIQEYRDLANVYAEDTTISRRARDEIQNQLGADATDLARDAIGRDLPGDPADPLLPPE